MADDKDEREKDERDQPETGTGAEGTESQSETDDQSGDLAGQVERMRRALAKANREAASNRKRLGEYEDRDKTEQQRAAERSEAAEKRAAEAERKLLRLEVAARKGLPAELAMRLQGSTEDELEEDADALSKLIGDKGEKRARRGDPDQGKGNGRADSDDMDMNDWLRRAAGVRAE